ncbi:MAG: beta-galactosidase, partial [Oscillospiraceae bacterium]|nr:beta-galactosidase [Oscillospiraceae bacterium]
VNFGTELESQRKGIIGGVKINDHRCFGFEIFPLPLDERQIAALDFDGSFPQEYPESGSGLPAFYRFEFTADEPYDTFLDIEGFGRGCAFINGFNLGRFWKIGPQKRLYIPAPLIKKGANTIVLFENSGKSAEKITLCDTPDLG